MDQETFTRGERWPERPRFSSLHIRFDHWVDREIMEASYRVHAPAFLEDLRSRGVLTSASFPPKAYEVWLGPDGSWREEVFGETGALQAVNGENQDAHWNYHPHLPEPLFLVATRREAIPGSRPMWEGNIHPLIGELLWLSDLNHAEFVEFDRIGESTLVGRAVDVYRFRVRDGTWNEIAFPWCENLWPGDDHEIRVDPELAIALRMAARFGDKEFSVREAVSISVDEGFDDALFRPPV